MFTVLSPRFGRKGWSCLFALAGILAVAFAHADDLPDASAAARAPLIQLGPGDVIDIKVYGESDLNATAGIADDGTVPVALAGPVHVAGLSPEAAARNIELALKKGHFVNDPHVTITVEKELSQRVSVLGEVGTPGRYLIDSHTTIFDLLAQAGGTRSTSANVIYIVRSSADGASVRFPVDLRKLSDPNASLAADRLQAGDLILVPKQQPFYIYGEVKTPGMYPLDEGLTVEEALARAGGLTALGSKHRIEFKRHDPSGKEIVTHARLEDLVRPSDVILVRESLF